MEIFARIDGKIIESRMTQNQKNTRIKKEENAMLYTVYTHTDEDVIFSSYAYFYKD